MADPVFCRPSVGHATRHLFVGNCGPRVGLSEQQIQNLFSDYGEANVHIPDPDASHVYVSYPNEQQAHAAMAALSDQPVSQAGNRAFNIRYADIKVRKVLSIAANDNSCAFVCKHQ